MSNLFVRKATGLVRSWSVMDAFVYAFFSINLITLGLYSFSQMYYFEGGMINALIISAIFNIHVPPYKSGLDEAPELDKDLRPVLAGQSLKPVGSTALRKAIEEAKPLLGLHGHIHEGRGATRIGKTLCINPGSMYEQGTLLGAIVALGKNKIENYVLTSG